MTLTRRTFLTSAAALAGSLGTVRRSHASMLRAGRRIPPSDTVHLAVVGAGGRGADNLREIAGIANVKVVALCDCDARQAAESFKAHPDATKYSDWRRMLEQEKGIDAVLVATPDHNHAIVSISAMKLGKHVYCEKPLAHSIWEAREMARVAGEMRVATQMGIQGHAFVGSRRAVEVLRAGAIGEVKELHVWTDRPAGWWPQGITRPVEAPPVPEGLDWDVWLGPAPTRPYNDAYVPFKWRGFWDFGTGALGDMGIHNLDTAYWGLELTAPTSVRIKDCSPSLTDPSAKETAPLWSILEFEFPARGVQPAVKMTWYDGGKLPPQELFQGEKLITHDGGSLVIGSKGTLFTRTWHGGESDADMFLLLPRKSYEGFVPPPETLTRPASHHHEWIDACLGNGPSLANFGYAAVLTESVLLGNVALRTGNSLQWDHDLMRTIEADKFIKSELRRGWSL